MKKKIKSPSNEFKNALRFGRHLLALAILFFLCKHLFERLQEIKVESISFNPFWLLISNAILIAHRVVRTFPWLTIYRNTTSYTISFLSSWTLMHLSEPAKYLPGKVGQFVGMAALCGSLQISADVAIASTLLNLVIKCFLGCFIGVPFILSSKSKDFMLNILSNIGSNSFRISAIILIIIGLGVVFLIAFRNRLSSKIPYLKKVTPAIFSFNKLLQLIVIHLLLWACASVSFFLFIKSIYPIPIVQLPIISSIYPFAWSIGFMSLITPSGLGVREGVLSVFLTTCLPPVTATLVALLSRLWVISVDILLAGVAWGCYIRQKRIMPNIQNSTNKN